MLTKLVQAYCFGHITHQSFGQNQHSTLGQMHLVDQEALLRVLLHFHKRVLHVKLAQWRRHADAERAEVKTSGVVPTCCKSELKMMQFLQLV